MLTHSAKRRVPSQRTDAKIRSCVSHHNSEKFMAWATTGNTGLWTRRNGQDLRIGSRAAVAMHLYGRAQRYIVRQKPSEDSLLGSPSWSENVWCRRCRLT